MNNFVHTPILKMEIGPGKTQFGRVLIVTNSVISKTYRLPRSYNLFPHSIMLSTLTGPEILHFTGSQSYKTALSF